MKLRLMICAAAAGTALFAEDVTSATYGVLAVSDTETHNTVVGVPWRNVSETLSDVTLSNLVSTATLAENDKVYLYEETRDGSAITTNWYEYVCSGTGVLEPSTTVFGKTYATPGAADVKTLSRGAGLIIQRKSITTPIYLCGRYDDTTLVGSTTIPANSTALIANPLTTNKEIGSSVGSNGDEIRIPLDNGGLTIYTKKDGAWGHYVETTSTSRRGGTVTTQTWTPGCTLAAGRGAWYVCGDTEATIAW